MTRKALTSEQRKHLVKRLEAMKNSTPSDEKFEPTVLKMDDPLIKKMLGRTDNKKKSFRDLLTLSR